MFNDINSSRDIHYCSKRPVTILIVDLSLKNMAKIVSWNINGVRSLPQPLPETIASLDADICCFQETKVTRGALDTSIAFVDGYNSYFGFCRKREGYSGVATYCKDNSSPVDAQEGLTSIFSTRQSSSDSRFSENPSLFDDIFTSDELKALDGEGRAVITRHKLRIDQPDRKSIIDETIDHDRSKEASSNGNNRSRNNSSDQNRSSIIADHDSHSADQDQSHPNSTKYLNIINVYCPRLDPEKADRKEFKRNFYRLLQIRASDLLKSGDHVLIVGDLNCSHKRIDHCDPDADAEFDENESRKWMDQFLYQPHGPFRDDDQAISSGFIDLFRYFYSDAREAFACWCNYKNARAINFGSRIDYAIGDFGLIQSDLIADVKHLTDIYGSDHCPVQVTLKNCHLIKSDILPRSCTKFMPEFKGEQQRMHQFLVKRTVAAFESEKDTTKKKAKVQQEYFQKSSKTLIDFFGKKTDLATKISDQKIDDEVIIVSSTGTTAISSSQDSISSSQDSASSVQIQIPALSQDSSISHGSAVSSKSSTETENGPRNETVAKWNQLFKPKIEHPLCIGHQEPSVLRISKKPGPNLNRRFYSCGRPIGKNGDPNASCNFFRWAK